MPIKRERTTRSGDKDITAEMEPHPHQSRGSSVATLVDGPIPLRASSVPGCVHQTTLPTPADTNRTSNNDDVEMADGALPPAADAMEVLGQRSRALIEVIQKLSALKINTTLKSLPKIVLIGDQSAGKSSIIEALCDITLPRSEGTCTRCPFLLTTTSSTIGNSSWTCRVSILTKYAYVSSIKARKGGEKFDHWQEQQEGSYAQFSVIYDKKDLDQTLRRAQQAILNPAHDPSEFVNTYVDPKGMKANQVNFSPNTVCLEIAAANLPELSFYDLPGAINSMSNEDDQYLVKFVETLLKYYIQDENATVLLACAANQDVETSTAIRFLTECRTPKGQKARERALGVLTKPDLVDVNVNKITKMNDILGGTEYPMGHGWFVTKQSSQKQLGQGITHDQARKAESDFFATSPWADELAAYQNRFGTPKLQNALSDLLTRHILQELPGIVSRVKSRLNGVNQVLATFPAQDAAPTIAVIQEIDALKTALLAQLNADNVSDFRTAYRRVYRDLQSGLAASQPFVELTTPGRPPKPDVVALSSDEESPSKKSRPNESREFSVAPSRTPVPTPATERRRKQVASTSAIAANITRVKFNLDEVKSSFDSAPGADMPGGTSNIVTKKLILDTLCGWQLVTNDTLQTVRDAFDRMLDECVSSSLAARQGTDLFKEALKIVRALFKELLAKQTATIDYIVARELHRPITHAREPMKQKTAQHKSQLQARRLRHRVKEWYEDMDTAGYSRCTEVDAEKKLKDPNCSAWALEKLGADPYEREVDGLAVPLAYYDVAATQLCDTVARELEFGLLHAYEQRVHRRLLEDLRTGDATHCARLLAADPRRERERVELLAEKEKLTQALAELNTLPHTHA